jgi:UDP-glucose:(heptosyl)LPS alpha-1,3-glucosyltransferase
LPSAHEVTIVAHDIGAVRGGMERQLTELVTGLVDRGHSVQVIGRTCELPAGANVTFHRVRGPGRPFLVAYPWFLVAGTLAVRRLRRGLVQATGAIVLNRVDVVAVHYCQQVGTATASRDTPLFRAHIRLTGTLKRAGERLCFRRSRAGAFVCVSEGVAEEIRAYYPELAARVVTIYNGVDTDSFAPQEHVEESRSLRVREGIAPGQLVAAFVGSEWERKGLAETIRALALAPEWLLVVAGAGDRERYERLAAEEGVAERIRWLGPRGDMQAIYGASDAFVMASSYETFSLVTFEDARNGFLVTPEAPVIAERLRRLGGDPQLRDRLGAEARRSALAFGRERMIAEHSALYERLAGS